MTSAALPILVGALALGYANGANDNFKGVATLYGAGALTYRAALLWATVTTLMGSLAAIFLARELVVVFTGKGLIPDALVGDPAVLLAVVAGAGSAVFLAARLGIPISTTHALTGALAGAGLAAVGAQVNFATLGTSFLLPLAVSPLVPVALVAVAYPAVRRAGDPAMPPRGSAFAPVAAAFAGDARACHAERDARIAAAAPAASPRARALDALHLLSAGAVGFARGLNDTPKIVAIAAAAAVAEVDVGIVLVALAMAAGGLLHADKIACTMACRITPMSMGQGAIANFATSGIVVGASLLGMPVSTTHVSCGALFGIGAATKKLRWKVAGGILSAWLLTLPAAGAIAACAYVLL